MKLSKFVFIILSILHAKAHASSCIRASNNEYVKTAQFALIGRVTSIENHKVSMAVIESFSQPVGKKVILDLKRRVRIAGEPEAEDFSLGVEYFIASNTQKDSISDAKIFRPHVCEIYRRVDEAKDLILIAREKNRKK